VVSPVGIADGTWHQVTCRRTATGVALVLDGTVRASASMQVVTLSNGDPVTIGAKDVSTYDNDQFHGRLDRVVVRFL
jgi:hypothetical protein